MDSVSFQVYGNPAPKGSVTRMRNGAYLPAGTPASRMNFNNWKENIATASRVAMDRNPAWPGAIRLMAEFQLPVPQSMPQKRWGWVMHTKRPDLDKLARALFDPMKGIVWVDDSQVCFCTINKVYAWNRQPGCFVVVDFLTDKFAERYSQTHRKITDVVDSL